MLTKKNVLIVSGLVAQIFLIINHVGTYAVCNQNDDCAHLIANTLRTLIIVFPLAILSFLTYFLRDEIFKTWIFFAKIWVPLSIFLTIITPETTGDSFVPYYGRPHVAIAMSVLFLVISLILIVWKTRSIRRT